MNTGGLKLTMEFQHRVFPDKQNQLDVSNWLFTQFDLPYF
jgi:hypothetical protein